MEFWIFLICAVLLFLLYPYLRCFVKRIQCAQKIRRVCREKGFHLHPTHLLWFLGHKRLVFLCQQWQLRAPQEEKYHLLQTKLLGCLLCF